LDSNANSNSDTLIAKNKQQQPQQHGRGRSVRISNSNSLFTSSLKKFVLQGEEPCAQVKMKAMRCHPKICTFLNDRPNTVAVVGLDEMGNVFFFLASFRQNSNGAATNNNMNVQ